MLVNQRDRDLRAAAFDRARLAVAFNVTRLQLKVVGTAERRAKQLHDLRDVLFAAFIDLAHILLAVKRVHSSRLVVTLGTIELGARSFRRGATFFRKTHFTLAVNGLSIGSANRVFRASEASANTGGIAALGRLACLIARALIGPVIEAVMPVLRALVRFTTQLVSRFAAFIVFTLGRSTDNLIIVRLRLGTLGTNVIRANLIVHTALVHSTRLGSTSNPRLVFFRKAGGAVKGVTSGIVLTALPRLTFHSRTLVKGVGVHVVLTVRAEIFIAPFETLTTLLEFAFRVLAQSTRG